MTATTRVLSAMLFAALAVSGCCPMYEDVYFAQPLPGTPVYVEPAPVVHTTVIAEPYCPPPPIVAPVYHTSVHVVRPACPPPLPIYRRPQPVVVHRDDRRTHTAPVRRSQPQNRTVSHSPSRPSAPSRPTAQAPFVKSAPPPKPVSRPSALTRSTPKPAPRPAAKKSEARKTPPVVLASRTLPRPTDPRPQAVQRPEPRPVAAAPTGRATVEAPRRRVVVSAPGPSRGSSRTATSPPSRTRRK